MVKKVVDFIGHEMFLNKHKTQRENDRMKFHLISSETELIIESFNGENKKIVDFDQMNEFELNVWVQINQHVRTRRTYGDDKMIAFDTEMKAGGRFGWHSHNDCREIIEVQKGILYNLLDQKTTKSGEVISYPIGMEHIPTALEDSVLRVYFDKCQSNCPLIPKIAI